MWLCTNAPLISCRFTHNFSRLLLFCSRLEFCNFLCQCLAVQYLLVSFDYSYFNSKSFNHCSVTNTAVQFAVAWLQIQQCSLPLLTYKYSSAVCGCLVTNTAVQFAVAHLQIQQCSLPLLGYKYSSAVCRCLVTSGARHFVNFYFLTVRPYVVLISKLPLLTVHPCVL